MLTIAVGHDRDRYAQFEYSYKQLYHVEKFFKINIGPKEVSDTTLWFPVCNLICSSSHKASLLLPRG